MVIYCHDRLAWEVQGFAASSCLGTSFASILQTACHPSVRASRDRSIAYGKSKKHAKCQAPSHNGVKIVGAKRNGATAQRNAVTVRVKRCPIA